MCRYFMYISDSEWSKSFNYFTVMFIFYRHFFEQQNVFFFRNNKHKPIIATAYTAVSVVAGVIKQIKTVAWEFLEPWFWLILLI